MKKSKKNCKTPKKTKTTTSKCKKPRRKKIIYPKGGGEHRNAEAVAKELDNKNAAKVAETVAKELDNKNAAGVAETEVNNNKTETARKKAEAAAALKAADGDKAVRDGVTQKAGVILLVILGFVAVGVNTL